MVQKCYTCRKSTSYSIRYLNLAEISGVILRIIAEADPGGHGDQKTPLQNHIAEAKRMVQRYNNALKCIIS